MTPPATDRPVVFRPRRLRRVVLAFTLGLVGLSLFGWFALPGDIRALFALSHRITLLAFLGVLVGTIVAVAVSSVRADAEGLRIRNALRVHRVPWSRVHKVILRPGDAWALLLLRPADGSPFVADLDAERRMLMGVQTTDREAATAAVAELRRRQQRAQAREA